MIPAGVQVFITLDPVDMRYGFDRLSGIIRERVFGLGEPGGEALHLTSGLLETIISVGQITRRLLPLLRECLALQSPVAPLA